MKAILAILATLAGACILPTAALAENATMICTGPTGKDYTATYDGSIVILKNDEWSARLTVIEDTYGILITKANEKGVYTTVLFEKSGGLVNYFRGRRSAAYQQDRCRNIVGKTPTFSASNERNELFRIERFFETEGGSSKAILSVSVPAGTRYVDGQCAFKDSVGNLLDVSRVIALQSGYETVFGPGAASNISCKLAARY